MWRRVWSSSGTFAGTMMAQESPMVSTRLPCPVGPTSSFSYSTATSSPPSSSSRLLLRSLNGILSLPLSSSQSSCVPWLGATRVPVPSSLQFWYWLELYEAPIFSVGSSMEKLALKSLSSQAKVGGTVLSIAGAFIVTFYKGQLLTVSSTLHLPPHSSWGPWRSSSGITPVVLIIMFHINLFGTVFAALLSLIAVRDPELWALKWCSEAFLRCPTMPWQLAWGSGDRGRILSVMWGKAKEVEDMASGPLNAGEALPQTSHKIPLLAAQQS
ncbi:hypothetical protein CRG98_029658 [Punica granatum]|uniref:WAT1-related protein n=1 Tax=Punica granatum TaxID=22663 RepID=A0A2I0J210_PUNGR|nr:hypothetical protein CRG98_029658 [Punica granatum]